jgi:hypothetical protein
VDLLQERSRREVDMGDKSPKNSAKSKKQKSAKKTASNVAKQATTEAKPARGQ